MRPGFPLHFVLFQIYNKLTAGCGEGYLQKTIKLQGTIYFFADDRYQDFCNYNNCYVKLIHICFNVLPLAFKITHKHTSKSTLYQKNFTCGYKQLADRTMLSMGAEIGKQEKKGGDPPKITTFFSKVLKNKCHFHNSIPKKRNYLHRSWYFTDWKCYSRFPQLLP